MKDRERAIQFSDWMIWNQHSEVAEEYQMFLKRAGGPEKYANRAAFFREIIRLIDPPVERTCETCGGMEHWRCANCIRGDAEDFWVPQEPDRPKDEPMVVTCGYCAGWGENPKEICPSCKGRKQHIIPRYKEPGAEETKRQSITLAEAGRRALGVADRAEKRDSETAKREAEEYAEETKPSEKKGGRVLSIDEGLELLGVEDVVEVNGDVGLSMLLGGDDGKTKPSGEG